MCLLKQQCDAVGMVTSPSLQRFIAVWDFVHLAPTWKVINEILEFGSWWASMAWQGIACIIYQQPTHTVKCAAWIKAGRIDGQIF